LESYNEKYEFYNEMCLKNGEPGNCQFAGMDDIGELRRLFIQILNGLHCLHSVLDMAHGRIKPENIVLGPMSEAILIDSGVS